MEQKYRNSQLHEFNNFNNLFNNLNGKMYNIVERKFKLLALKKNENIIYPIRQIFQASLIQCLTLLIEMLAVYIFKLYFTQRTLMEENLLNIAKQNKIRMSNNNAQEIIAIIIQYGKQSQQLYTYVQQNIAKNFRQKLLSVLESFQIQQRQVTEEEVLQTPKIQSILSFVEQELYIEPEQCRQILSMHLIGTDYDQILSNSLNNILERNSFKDKLSIMIAELKTSKEKILQFLGSPNQKFQQSQEPVIRKTYSIQIMKNDSASIQNVDKKEESQFISDLEPRISNQQRSVEGNIEPNKKNMGISIQLSEEPIKNELKEFKQPRRTPTIRVKNIFKIDQSGQRRQISLQKVPSKQILKSSEDMPKLEQRNEQKAPQAVNPILPKLQMIQPSQASAIIILSSDQQQIPQKVKETHNDQRDHEQQFQQFPNIHTNFGSQIRELEGNQQIIVENHHEQYLIKQFDKMQIENVSKRVEVIIISQNQLEEMSIDRKQIKADHQKYERYHYYTATLNIQCGSDKINTQFIYKLNRNFIKKGFEFVMGQQNGKQQTIDILFLDNFGVVLIQLCKINYKQKLIGYLLSLQHYLQDQSKLHNNAVNMDIVKIYSHKLDPIPINKELNELFQLKNISSLETLRYIVYFLQNLTEYPERILGKIIKDQRIICNNKYKEPQFMSDEHKKLENTFILTVYKYLLNRFKRQDHKTFFNSIKNQRLSQQTKNALQFYFEKNILQQTQTIRKDMYNQIFQSKPIIKMLQNVLEKVMPKAQEIKPSILFEMLIRQSKITKIQLKNFKQYLEGNIKQIINFLTSFNRFCPKSEQTITLNYSNQKMIAINSLYQIATKLMNHHQTKDLQMFINFWIDSQKLLDQIKLKVPQFLTFWRKCTQKGFNVSVKELYNHKARVILQRLCITQDQARKQQLVNLISKCRNLKKNQFMEFLKIAVQKKLRIKDDLQKVIEVHVTKSEQVKQFDSYQLVKQINKINQIQNPWLYSCLQKLLQNNDIKFCYGKSDKRKNLLLKGQEILKCEAKQQLRRILIEKYVEFVKNTLKRPDIINFEIDLIKRIKSNKDQILLNKQLFSNMFVKLDLPQMKANLINGLKSENPQDIAAYVQFFKALRENILQTIWQNIIKQIKDKKIAISQLEKLFKNLPVIQKQNNQLANQIVKLNEQKQNFQSKLNSIIETLTQYKKHEQISIALTYFMKIKKRVKQEQICILFDVKEIYRGLFDSSLEIQVFMNLQKWNKQDVKNIASLLEQKKLFKADYQLFFKSYEDKNLTLAKFNQFFPHKAQKSLIKYCNNNKIAQAIKITAQITTKKNVTFYDQLLSALNYITNIIQKKSIEFEQLKRIKVLIQEKKEDEIILDHLQKTITNLRSQLKKKGIDSLIQDQINKTILKTGTCRAVFETIQNLKITNKVVDDLKQYVNDLENSILRLSSIKQLEQVVIYWNLIKKHKSFKKFLDQLKNQLNRTKWIFSESIDSTYKNLKLIEQKIDESKNRETSFKYEVKNICQNSFFELNVLENNQIIIQITSKAVVQNIQKIKNKKKNNAVQDKISFAKLINYKERSLLLINDFERTENVDQKTRNMIEIFRQYCQLTQIIETINANCQTLAKYGYEIKSLQCKIAIKDKKYQKLKQFAQQTQTNAKKWIQTIQTTYESSYLLTHFLGPQLSNFVNNIYNKKYDPVLQRIVDINQQQFDKLVGSHKFRTLILHKKKQDPVTKIENIKKLFQDCGRRGEYKDKQRQIQFVIWNEAEQYVFLFDQQRMPQIYQVLYCQTDTKPEQIQSFLKRCNLSPNRIFYVLSIHNLNSDLQLHFCEYLNKYFTRGTQGNCGKLVLVNSSQKQQIYSHLCRQDVFNMKIIDDLPSETIKKRKKIIADCSRQTFLIQSARPGLGKTFQAQKRAQGKNLRYLPLSGNINFNSITSRLKKMKLTQNDALLIQIGHIENKAKLQVFLFQFIMFRAFNHYGYMFFPANLQVIIQLENLYKLDKEEFWIINILKQNPQKHTYIDKFLLEKLDLTTNYKKDAFVLHYLNLIQNKQIAKVQLKQRNDLQIPSNSKELINLYFLSNEKIKMSPSYSIYRRFMDTLYVSFTTFSKNVFLSPRFSRQSNKFFNINQIRLDFAKTCVQNAIQCLQQVITTNQFDQRGTKVELRKKLKQFPLLILPSNQFDTYSFVYLEKSPVPLSIKTLLLSQDTIYNTEFSRITTQQHINESFNKIALYKLEKDLLELKLFQILSNLSGNRKFEGKSSFIGTQLKQDEKKPRKQLIYKYVPQLKNYSLTLDNFFKMCLIIQRSHCNIPIIIMGESGVGKTTLIEFLVQTVLQEKLKIFNVHAGINENSLVTWFKEILQFNELLLMEEGRSNRFWVFFDQFNTTDQLGYIKEMMVDRRFMGQPIPDNIVFIAACNPYRKKINNKVVRVGIKKKSEAKNNLVFKVNPPPLSMIQFMWDYQQLGQQQNKNYISKILEPLNLKEHEKLVSALCYIHKCVEKQIGLSSVSLRDIQRFKEIYDWFLSNMPSQPSKIYSSSIKFIAQQQLYGIPRQTRAMMLSLTFCYSLKFATKRQRQQFLAPVQIMLGFDKLQFSQILKAQQIEYLNRLKRPASKIAMNFALRENVFSIIVCLLNKIPILIIGNPGSSKSLSTKIVSSNFRGKSSESEFCQRFPQINMIYFQGSQSCTSQGIENIYNKAVESKKKFDQNKKNEGMLQNCILFDEIGLAEKSIHNPLKVLHSKLQTSRKQIGFIGISNWELDAAKMSRFLVLARSTPDLEELQDTAIQIFQSYFQDLSEADENFSRKLARIYYQFVNKWDKLLIDQGFFGLRDFYCFVKNTCQEIQRKGQNTAQSRQQAMIKSLVINFDGKPNSLEILSQILALNTPLKSMLPKTMLDENLKSNESRCLLLIVKGDALIPIVQKSISQLYPQRQIVCIYGSPFQNDQSSQEYNLQITARIISHISRGDILTFKDINNSIQTSLYDLFNKSFYEIGEKRYCRIAVGANSNPKCYVHQNFKSIVFLSENKIDNTDLAFLNRFQKHHLNINSVMTPPEFELVEEITQWIDRTLTFVKEKCYLKKENFIINICEQSIVTLVLKYKNLENSSTQVKKSLLKNRTIDFDIALKNGKIDQEKTQEITQLIRHIGKNKQFKEDTIMFTYDHFIQSSQSSRIWGNKAKKLSISEKKSEKQLRKFLQNFFNPETQEKLLTVHLNYMNQFHNIDILLHDAKQIKQHYKSDKIIVIIIQLHRFSFTTLNIETVNISYSHSYDQIFMDNVSDNIKTEEYIECTYYDELIQKMNLFKSMQQIAFEALKRFKFTPQIQTDRNIANLCFRICICVIKNQKFLKKMYQFLKMSLNKKKIDFLELLQNKEQIEICSSVKQAIFKLVRQKCAVYCCHFLELCIESNLIYQFETSFLLNDPEWVQNQKIHLAEQIIKGNQKNYDIIFQNTFTKLVTESRKKKFKPFHKGIQSNVIKVRYPTLFPATAYDFTFIFKSQVNDGGQKIYKLTKQLLELFHIEDKKNIAQYRANLRRAQQKFDLLSSLQKQDWQEINLKKNQLRYIYLADLFQLACIQLGNIKYSTIFFFCYLLINVLEDLKISQLIIIITIDLNYWMNLMQMYEILIKCDKRVDIEQIVQQNYQEIRKKNNTYQQDKMQLEQNEKNITHHFLWIAQSFLSAITMTFSIQKFQTFKPKIFLQNISLLTTYIRRILNTYSEFGITANHQNFNIQNKLIQTFSKIFQQNVAEKLTEISIKQAKSRDPLVILIFNYCNQLLMHNNDCLKGQHLDVFFNYLCFDIFPSWFLIQDQNTIKCVTQFINFSNNHVYFANNSVFFLQKLFPEFLEAKTIQQQIKTLTSFTNERLLAKLEQTIDFQNNFSVSLGNFISRNIIYVVSEDETILEDYFELFKEFVNKSQKITSIERLFRMEFCKIYLTYYLKDLYKGWQNPTMNAIDILLQKEAKLQKHLKLYLVKKIFYDTSSKTLEEIRKKYLDVKKCNWIQSCQELIIEADIKQIYIPPHLCKPTDKIIEVIRKFRQDRYINSKLFRQIIEESLKGAREMYQCLTFFTTDFYTATVPEQLCKKHLQQFEKIKCVKQPSYQAYYSIIRAYMTHSVTKRLQVEGKINQQIFTQEHMPLLNCVNIAISLSKFSFCPFLQMFFAENGTIKNMFYWLQHRFHINGKQNIMFSQLKQLIQAKDSNGYYKCSATCDYYYGVGGGALGCEKVIVQKNLHQAPKCPCCRGVLGATKKYGVLDREKQGARKVQYDELKVRLQEVCEKRKINIQGKENQLVGYTFGNNIQQVQQGDRNNTRIQDISKRIFYFFIFSTWYILTDAKIIQAKQMAKLMGFNQNNNSVCHFLEESSLYYQKKLKDLIQFDDIDTHMIWQFGIIKIFFQTVQTYKSPTMGKGLKSCWERDECQRIISKRIVQFSGGIERQKLIKESRNTRQGMKLSKINLIKQQTSWKQFQQQYPYLRIFKYNFQNSKPSYENLIKFYLPSLSVSCPFLSQIINNQQSLELFSHFKTIYKFISKLLKNCNFKITRQYARRATLKQFKQDYLNEDEQFQNQCQNFQQAWNFLVQRKYKLQLGCHNEEKLGKLQPIDIQSSNLWLFLPEIGKLDNQNSQKCVALLSITAAQYNQVCRKLQNAFYKLNGIGSSLFSKKLLNPTEVNDNSKLLCFPMQLLEETIDNFSSFSVQYGIKTPHYALDEIEALIVKSMKASRQLQSNYENFNFINYAGQMKNYINQLRENNDQITLQIDQQKEPVKNYIFNLYQKSKDIFFKTIKTIQGSLQNIIVYYKNIQIYKNSKQEDNNNEKTYKTLRQFIDENHIKGLCSQIFQNPFKSIKINAIVDLYQTIQKATFEQIPQSLDPMYCSQELSKEHKKQIQDCISKMKSEKSEICPSFEQFRIALYRFVCRKLLPMECNENVFLDEFLFNIEQLWPVGVDPSNYYLSFSKAFKIELSKTRSLLEIIKPPTIEEQQSKAKVLEAKKDKVDISHRPKPEKLLDRRKKIQIRML